jgi:isopentenyl-diphosphate Delta-isomerase
MKTVILTNEEGETLEKCEIIEAHTNGGKLHKAFSAMVFNEERTKMLIQKRADAKMLWPGYWSNTCCSHPEEEHEIEEEAAIRLQEECGFTCPLITVHTFIYKADDPGGRGTEHEYDTVLVGAADENIELKPDPEEIAEMKWVNIEELQQNMKEDPSLYTPWFHKIMEIL